MQEITPKEDVENVSKKGIQEFWDQRPFGEYYGGRGLQDSDYTVEYLASIDQIRYEKDFPHIIEFTDFKAQKNKNVLEVGSGPGNDSSMFARAGANVTALDLSPRNIQAARKRFKTLQVPGKFLNGDAENLPFLDNTFDFIYSHGVLHHTPNTDRTIQEIYRVLKPGGQALIYLYHKNSAYYWLNTMVLGRLMLFLLRFGWFERFIRWLSKRQNFAMLSSEHILNKYIEISRSGQQVSHQELVNAIFADGPYNPLSQVFTRKEIRQMYRQFQDIKQYTCWLGPIPLLGLLLPKSIENWLGYYFGGFVATIGTKGSQVK
jgi:ubiquinone/menaquinone biosynthesis C-methylase UbiE